MHTDGGMRPFISVPIDKLHKSENLSLEQLALVEMLEIGAHAIERAAPQPDEPALVIGAGPIGLAVCQFAMITGTNVVVMDVNAGRLGFCRDTLGVKCTIDATAHDATHQIRQACGDDLPTLILDATGNPASMMATFDLIAPAGRIVFVGLVRDEITFDDPNFHRRKITLLSTRNATGETFTRVIKEMESGRIDTQPWITHRMALTQVPQRFPQLSDQPNLVKAMIEC